MAVSAKSYQTLSCLKLFTVIFTVIYLFTGVLLLAVGIYALIALQHYFDLSPGSHLYVTPPAFCGLGGLIIISGLFGLVSAVKNNKCLINSYCLLLGIVFCIELTGGVVTIVFMNQLHSAFKDGFTNAIATYQPTATLNRAIDKAQRELECCGADSYEDWFRSEWANSTAQCIEHSTQILGVTVPLSCCKAFGSSNLQNSTEITNIFDTACYCGDEAELVLIYNKGCLPALFGSNGETLHYVLATAFGSAVILLISMALLICIYRKLREIRMSRRY